MKEVDKNYYFKPIDTSTPGLRDLSIFLCKTFKSSKLSSSYLNWMYNQNPNGPAIGFNAFIKDELAGHYALIPLEASYKSKKIKALLSVNTATGSDHQGQGLFTILAEKTYFESTKLGFDIVFGVANANSIYGFIKKLDFNHIGQLDSCISIGLPKKIMNKNLYRCMTFPLSEKSIRWRLSNPNFRYSEHETEQINFIANNMNYFARSIIKIDKSKTKHKNLLIPKLNFWVGISNSYSWNERPMLSIKMPEFLKPSPLHLIYKSLTFDINLDKNNIHFEAINFDAF